MNEDPLPHLQDVLLRRELSPAEEQSLAAWLARHPDRVASWREDVRLSRALRRLPDVPVPADFTSRVLDDIRRDLATTPSAGARRTHTAPGPWSWAWLRPAFWVPIASTAAVVALAFGAWEWNVQRHQAVFNRDVTPLRALASVPQEVLEDFDAIQRFGQSSAPVDFELLAALE